ncbi:MAG: DUF1295 domain-containing protein [Clostridia bacterium]|nr:DUF1295 domain-containing protein [Clostridia bacterium]
MNTWTDKRGLSFTLVTITYVIASALGILVFNALNYQLWLNLLIADVISTAIVFAVSIAVKNSSVYDPYWSVQPIVILCALAIKYGVNSAGALILAVVCVWGVRLTANWAYTFQNLNWQDWRYTMLKEKTGRAYPLINFLGIHLFPTIVVYLCVMPAVYLIESGAQINRFLVLGCVISLLGALTQAIADVQMHKYRKNRVGNFIRTGLWKHSRHPNYLGEILMWWGVAIACAATLNKVYLITGAVVNMLMFFFVSIPMADKRQSRKEGFEEYKRQTRMLLPIKKF